jgi:hypothetical protein
MSTTLLYSKIKKVSFHKYCAKVSSTPNLKKKSFKEFFLQNETLWLRLSIWPMHLFMRLLEFNETSYCDILGRFYKTYLSVIYEFL